MLTLNLDIKKTLLKLAIKEANEFLNNDRSDADGIRNILETLTDALDNYKPVKIKKVEISVDGGCVNPVSIPKGIELYITDYDNDPDGEKYFIDSDFVEHKE